MSLRLDDQGRLVVPDSPEARIFLEALWAEAERQGHFDEKPDSAADEERS